MIAYELGYRLQPIDRLNVDLAGYYNKYDDIRGSKPNSPILAFSNGSPYVLMTNTIINAQNVDIYGAEMALEWQPLDWWRIKGTYTFAEMKKNQAQGDTSAENFSFAPP